MRPRQPEPAPPDGGWGWVVVGAAFLSTAIQMGLTFAVFAILYPDIIQAFDSSAGAVGVANLVLILSNNISGFLVSPFADRWGLRTVNAVGYLIGFLSMAASAFSPNLVVFILLFGLFAGSGYGAGSLSRMACVQKYFDKNRTLATGLVTVGMGFSLIIFGPLTRFFANIYGWRGALLMNGGIGLHCVVLSGAFRPLKGPRTKQNSSPPVVDTGPAPVVDPGEQRGTRLRTMSSEGGGNSHSAQKDTDATNNSSGADAKNAKDQNKCCEEDTHKLDAGVGQQQICSTEETHQSREAKYTKKGCEALRSILNFGLLLDVRFDVLVMGGILMDFGVMTMLNHLPNRAIHGGMDKTMASYLTSFFGGANLVGKVVTSVAANSSRVNNVLCYSVVIVVGGIITCCSSLASTFADYAILATCSGLCMGSIFALHYTALRDTVGLDTFQRALGIHMLLFGTTTCFSVPFGGWLFDITRNYSVPFWVNGSLQVLGGCLILPLGCLPRRTVDGHTQAETDEGMEIRLHVDTVDDKL